MTKQPTIQDYINNFRRRISPFLRPGVGLRCTVHPAAVGGAILECTLQKGIPNEDRFLAEMPTLGKALQTIPQKAFGGNFDGFLFQGTNLIMEPERIVLIKDDSDQVWSDTGAQEDVSRITGAAQRQLASKG